MLMRNTLLRLALVAGFTFSAPLAAAEELAPDSAPAAAESAPAALAATAAVQPGTAGAADPAQLVRQVNIPYETFTLNNGLRVVVHEDRKAPIVAVSIW